MRHTRGDETDLDLSHRKLLNLLIYLDDMSVWMVRVVEEKKLCSQHQLEGRKKSLRDYFSLLNPPGDIWASKWRAKREKFPFFLVEAGNFAFSLHSRPSNDDSFPLFSRHKEESLAWLKAEGSGTWSWKVFFSPLSTLDTSQSQRCRNWKGKLSSPGKSFPRTSGLEMSFCSYKMILFLS